MQARVRKPFSLLTKAALALWFGAFYTLLLNAAPIVSGAPSTEAAQGWSRTKDQRESWAPEAGCMTVQRGATLHLEVNEARAVLSRAPREQGHGRIEQGVEWLIPTPDGQMKRFLIVESPVMAPGLAARYPGLKTYRGVGLQDPRDRLRMDLRDRKLHAQVLGPNGNFYIDPIDSEPSDYVSYDPGSALRTADESFECLTDTTSSAALSSGGGGFQSDGMVRVYRLAVAATGEYTQFHGGAVADGLGAIVTAVNRLNGIYESELGIRFTLVDCNDQLVFTNPAVDPYSNDDAVAMLSQNQSTLDAIVGSANYDVGQVLATGGGGLAQVASVCVAGWKGRGVTGRANPVGDSFYVDYLAHEIGHQFGAHHTFNGVAGSCSAENRHPQWAYEPGSGSTIMSYSGICGSDNIQYASDAYFHSASLVEMHSFIQSGCAAPDSVGNLPPMVDAGADRVVPMGTPFELAAAGSDPDGDPLTYCWEQLDLGNATPLDGLDHGAGPLFRSYLPVNEPVRVFPRMANLLLNISSPAEVLPTTDRAMTFRVTARDCHPGGGAFAMDTMKVTVTTAAGPFRVLNPNTAGELSGDQTVTWDVAGTYAAPVSTAFVDILLSTNGGMDFPVLLAGNTPNDGMEVVRLPEIYAGHARIQVRASGNVFFDISDADFSIAPAGISGLEVVTKTNCFQNATAVLLPASGTKGNASVFPLQVAVSNLEGVVEHVTVQLHGLTHGFVDDLDVLLVGPGGQAVMLLSDAGGGAMANDVEVDFSDEGGVFPTGGILPAGEYQPVNVGTTGDSFPVATPYSAALSAFNEVDPNGVWSLYLVDDSTGDAGSLSAGWSLTLQTRTVVQHTNQPPLIVAQPCQFVHVGMTLVVTNVAVDPDGEGTLTFALRPDSPAGAVVDEEGVLTWSPGESQVGTTNVCGVTVTDSGTPALTTESEFDVVVVGPPVIQSLVMANGLVHLKWSTVPSGSYRLEFSSDLNLGTWVPLGEPVVSAGLTTATSWPVTGAGQGFFRVRVEP